MISTTIRQVLTLCLLIPFAVAQADELSPIPSIRDNFRFELTPFLWFTGLSGVMDYKNTPLVDTHVGDNKILSNLAVGGMLDGEVHYGRYGLMGNGIYAKLSNGTSKSYLRDSALTVDSHSDAWMGIYTVAGTYTAYVDKSIYLDVLAGARFLNLNTKIQLDASVANTSYTGAKTLYSSVSSTDAIAGFKGRVRIADSLFYVPFYVDAGGGSSTAKFTTQETLGIGYAFEYADVSVVYNNLYYSMSNGNKSSYVNMGGPMVAATFRF